MLYERGDACEPEGWWREGKGITAGGVKEEPNPGGRTLEERGHVIQPPRQVMALEFRKVLDKGSKTKPMIFDCREADGSRRQYVVKLRHPPCPVGQGHWEGTSLACEMICGVVGRAIGITVPDYAVVELPDRVLDGVPPELRALVARNCGPNFGSAYIENVALWRNDARPGNEEIVQALEDVLTFDATIVNGDRKSERPNLLWHGGRVLAIDHALATPVILWNDETLAGFTMVPDHEIQAHCCYTPLSGRGRLYQDLLERWVTAITPDRLTLLRSWLPPAWERRQGHLDRIFNFLERRTEQFAILTRELRRLMR